MKSINVWAVYTTIDEYGRKGNLVIVTPDEAVADKYNNGAGWYGGVGTKEERKAVKAGKDKFYLIDEEIDFPIKLNEKVESAEVKLKKTALRKLTKAERLILDLE